MKAKLLIPAAICCAACLSSCSLTQTSAHKSIEKSASISFSWWGGEVRSDYTILGIKQYESENNNIVISPYPTAFSGYKETLDALISCGKESDIMQINYSWISEYSADGEGFYDLNELSEYIDLGSYTDEELSYGTSNGKLNAIPISLNAATFYYNQTLFDEYNLDIPKTWDDLFECAEVFSADGIYTIEASNIYYWLMLTAHEEQISGKACFGETESFELENVVSMMEFYKELIDCKVVPHKEYSSNDFFTSKAAGQLLWASDAQNNVIPLEEEGGEVTIGDYICDANSQRFGWYLKPTSLYAISKSTQNPEQAAKFLNYLINSEEMAVLQGCEKGFPLSRSAQETLEANDMFEGVSYEAGSKISQEERFELIPNDLENTERYSEFFDQFELYYYGEKTAEQAAEDFLEGWRYG